MHHKIAFAFCGLAAAAAVVSDRVSTPLSTVFILSLLALAAGVEIVRLRRTLRRAVRHIASRK